MPESALQLPVESYLPEIAAAIRNNSFTLLTAETGAGKSTWLPLGLLQELNPQKKIIMLAPRRLAVRMIARRLAQQLNEKPGQTIGYRTRMDSAISEKTRIEIVTDGIFLNLLQDNPELPDYELVIFDEFHERSLFSDLSLTFLKDALGVFCPDLRVLIMSATLDAEPLKKYLDCGNCLSVPGRSYPVDLNYLLPPHRDWRFWDFVADTIIQVLKESSGDILVFFPGQKEIRQVDKLINPRLPKDVYSHRLYGGMPDDAQDQAVRPSADGQRKIILSTPVAESSLSIPGISIVIDSGLERYPIFDLVSMSSSLDTRRISKSSAIQRAGRAGRMSEGVCYRLWEEAEFERMQPNFTAPVVQTQSLDTALQLARWGVSDPDALDWLDKPDPRFIDAAQSFLQNLQILDLERSLTEKGKRISSYGLQPASAVLLENGRQSSCFQTVCDCVALLELGDFCLERQSDVRIRLDALASKKSGQQVNQRLMKQLGQLSRRLLKRFDKSSEIRFDNFEELLIHSFPFRIVKRRAGEDPVYIGSGMEMHLHKGDHLSQSAFLLVLVSGGHKNRQEIFLAWPLTEKSLLAYGETLIRTDLRIEMADKKIQFYEDQHIANCVLKRRQVYDVSDEEYRKAFRDFLKQSPELCDAAMVSLQTLKNKAALLKIHEHKLYRALSDVIKADPVAMIMETLPGKLTMDDIEAVDWSRVYTQRLSWEEQQELQKLLPDEIEIGRGRPITVSYTENGEAEISVRLQRMFAVPQPKILDAQLPLKIHLLSPAGRPIQTTTDLDGFWEGSYEYVRRDMKGRYPKHDWPENPLEKQ